MDDALRGVIRNSLYSTQVRDFSSLRLGNITATDIDGLIEYKNKGYLLFETKFLNTELPHGQRLALERLSDDLHRVKPTLLIIASHETSGDIDVGGAMVGEYRFNRKWRMREGTVYDLVMAFIGYLETFR